MKSYKKYLIYIVLICIALSLHSCFAAAGSYSNSESYVIQLSSSDELIDSLIKLKEKHPEMIVYNKNENNEIVNMDEETLGFYYCHFLVDDICYMCAINTNQRNQENVSIYFVAIIPKDEIGRGGGKCINTDELNKKENEMYKKIFEETVLNRLGVSWRKESILDYF